MRRWVRGLVVVLCLMGVATGGAGAAEPAVVPELKLTGVVDPFIASYVKDGLARAAEAGAPAVLLTIDTPGGLDSSMREITEGILASKVPVLCYTSPSGARAASAGTFIMLSCPVAAMAPGTNIGAAHPVGVSGAIEQTKVTNDAAAYIRSLAERWNRNADWAERAVRDSISASAADALRLNVVDLVEPTVTELFQRADPSCLSGAAPPRAAPDTGLLATHDTIPGLCDATTAEDRMGVVASILHGLISPDLAFLFFFVGLALIVIELLHPGVSVPGILGGLLMVGAFVSFGLLPVQLIGVALLAASVGFFLLELKHPGIGFPLVAGVITLVLGGLFLFDRAVPNAQVSPWVIGPVAILLTLFFGFVVQAALRARHLPPPSHLQPEVGEEGVAETDLGPAGLVRIRKEPWSAEARGRKIRAGTSVRVVERRGLKVIVEPVTSAPDAKGVPAGRSPAEQKGGMS